MEPAPAFVSVELSYRKIPSPPIIPKMFSTTFGDCDPLARLRLLAQDWEISLKTKRALHRNSSYQLMPNVKVLKRLSCKFAKKLLHQIPRRGDSLLTFDALISVTKAPPQKAQ